MRPKQQIGWGQKTDFRSPKTTEKNFEAMSNLRRKIEEQIIEKAKNDDSFRKRLLENPKIVFELETGIKLPESLIITVLQEDQKTVYLVIPPLHEDAFEDKSIEVKHDAAPAKQGAEG